MRIRRLLAVLAAGILAIALIAFAENSFLNEAKWVSRESFQGAGFFDCLRSDS